MSNCKDFKWFAQGHTQRFFEGKMILKMHLRQQWPEKGHQAFPFYRRAATLSPLVPLPWGKLPTPVPSSAFRPPKLAFPGKFCHSASDLNTRYLRTMSLHYSLVFSGLSALLWQVAPSPRGKQTDTHLPRASFSFPSLQTLPGFLGPILSFSSLLLCVLFFCPSTLFEIINQKPILFRTLG